MGFENYLQQAWSDHATQAKKVAEGFKKATRLVESNEQLAQLTALVTHVMGEHLASWSEGIEVLSSFKKHPKFAEGTETEKAVQRSIEVLKIGEGKSSSLNNFSPSDQIRIKAIAASALCTHDCARAMQLLTEALSLAQTGLENKDPANRALAITGNNLACSLEEKSPRSQTETALMILAAHTGRKYWAVAGTWLEVSRADYRLAMTYLQAPDLKLALEHANSCLSLCTENKAGDTDMFFAFEALALVEKALKNELRFAEAFAQAKKHFELLPDSDKSWCQKTLNKLTELK